MTQPETSGQKLKILTRLLVSDCNERIYKPIKGVNVNDTVNITYGFGS